MLNPYRINQFVLTPEHQAILDKRAINRLPIVRITPGCKCASCSLERKRPWDGGPKFFKDDRWLIHCRLGDWVSGVLA